tara:strand:+ start:215 stop:577 length:363 start_codon:yes stop_codon:yes gene_type:complete
MLILEPTTVNQTIVIAPRSEDFTGVIVLNIRRDGDGKEQIITNASLNKIVNFTEVTFQSNILEEDSTYYLEITKDNNLWYRDKIYVTSQNATERSTNKHEIGNGTLYKTYNPVDDNTYII